VKIIRRAWTSGRASLYSLEVGETVMASKPGYRTFNGDAALPLPPPFLSLGLENRYFPLLADRSRLQAFCDRYLGLGDAGGLPEEVGRFEAHLPYVLLIDCTHRRLEVEREQYGWFSQRELTFAFLAEWHRKQQGRWCFEGLVFVNPFIYLDSPLGLTTGREVQGWPKVLARFDDRGGVHTLASDGADGLTARPLLQIEARPPGLFDDLTALPRRLAGSWDWLSRMTAAMPSMMGPPQDLETWCARWQAYLLPAQNWNIITLKQFRALEAPPLAAYQALVKSTMQTLRTTGLGPLGLAAMMCGDLSGGFRVNFHRPTADPILDLLGIQLTGGDHPLATATPMLPFQLDVDIRYSAGQVLCERQRGGPWVIADGAAPVPAAVAAPYLSVSPQSLQCLPGPLALDALDVHVLALRADPAGLLDLCRHWFGSGGEPPVRPDGDVAYLVIGRGQARNLGTPPARWAFQGVGFYIPAVHDGQPVMIAPFELVDEDVSATMGRELYGANAAVSRFSGAWMTDPGDHPGDSAADLVTVRAQSFVAIHQGQEAHRSTLMQVRNDPAGAAPSGAAGFFAALTDAARSLSIVSLKQYRDAAQPERACYQAIVARSVTLQARAASIEPAPLLLRLHPNASLPLARALGLSGMATVREVPVLGTLRLEADVTLTGGSILA
jgi:hypothetical protein